MAASEVSTMRSESGAECWASRPGRRLDLGVGRRVRHSRREVARDSRDRGRASASVESSCRSLRRKPARSYASSPSHRARGHAGRNVRLMSDGNNSQGRPKGGRSRIISDGHEVAPMIVPVETRATLPPPSLLPHALLLPPAAAAGLLLLPPPPVLVVHILFITTHDDAPRLFLCEFASTPPRADPASRRPPHADHRFPVPVRRITHSSFFLCILPVIFTPSIVARGPIRRQHRNDVSPQNISHPVRVHHTPMSIALGYNTAIPTASMDYAFPFSRHSNTAGAPLPRIPKRSSSSSRIHHASSASLHSIFTESPSRSSTSPSATSTTATTTTSPALVVQPPTPPRSEGSRIASGSGSSSSSDSPLVVGRHRRTRSGTNMPSVALRPPEESTPVPSKSTASRVAWPLQPSAMSFDDDDETPRPSSSKISKHRPETTTISTSSNHATRSASVSIPASITSQLVRKKSGEPLKSSLKSRRAIARGDLSVITGPGISSKSEPNTPSHIKSVHFDAKLEHVKLFLAEQKPAAVSRDGSPTTDTSGTENDWPGWIYGAESRGRETKKGALVMEVMNMPERKEKKEKLTEKTADKTDVLLEEFVLSADGTSANGRVRVRNIAFEKWVAIRFTFDWWQTTSEVTAKYVQTLPGGVFDVFAFTIRLGDMLARIEEKTLFLAVRYTAAGKEIWDNNGGENYRARFARRLQESAQDREKERRAQEGIADLKTRLEKVASAGVRETLGGYLAQRKSSSPSHSPSGSDVETFNLRSHTSLSSRYDFSASLRSPWKHSSPTSPTAGHARNSTYPNTLPHFPARTFQAKSSTAFVTRGSPRMLDPDDLVVDTAAFYANSDSEDTPASTPVVFSRQRGRNHQRGYFDLHVGFAGAGAEGGVRKTLPTAFREEGPRLSSVDTYRVPAEVEAVEIDSGKLSATWAVERGGSEESTPSITSTSESSRSSSPSGSPVEDSLLFKFLDSNPDRARSPVMDNSYHVFLNKFCFYTGSDSMLDVQQDSLQRSRSASSVEEFLSTPNPNYLFSPAQTPPRSSSYDDVARMSVSGSSTPTARGMVESESSTPMSLAY
ncbi:carbohydrate-binding module family 21 protein [Laetiporus sulphureus 93-53]|uniref:Carbohydrate-binding module family 21 protein n=1 Tax=Laetiporus sulphureus 93-53 TaxID=1314785 RepID=A0A165H1T3_9APHY|nr:carbohydrate-binding module family 21 protein [Laetiporus sulphureus 93-53]KZT11126.1 carbohydrate-binding module family 21 protein [Laetiporus sulphureus 93-53]